MKELKEGYDIHPTYQLVSDSKRLLVLSHSWNIPMLERASDAIKELIEYRNNWPRHIALVLIMFVANVAWTIINLFI